MDLFRLLRTAAVYTPKFKFVRVDLSTASKLDTLANLATILLAVLVGSVLVLNYLRPTPHGGVPSPYEGENIGDLLPIDFGRTSRTAILVVQQNCSFCDASMPFYRRLVAERDRRQADVHVVFVAPERDVDIEDYLESREVRPDSVVHLDSSSGFRVPVTPTLVVVDRSGVVTFTRMGQVPQEDERETIERVLSET